MAIEYLGLSAINGPMVVLEGICLVFLQVSHRDTVTGYTDFRQFCKSFSAYSYASLLSSPVSIQIPV